nr:hypothetical protein CFP56_29742 [Quercus suber]
MQFDREKVNSELDTVGAVLGQKHVQVDSGGSIGGLSKGGAVIGVVEKVETVASTGKLNLNFEAIISKLDQAIQLEPIISTSKSIRMEQLKDKSDIHSGLVDI